MIYVITSYSIHYTKLYDEFVEPLAFANILVKGTIKGTTSDFDGKYELELEAGTYTLVYSFVGYNTQEISDIVVKPNDVLTVDVTRRTTTLETVAITTNSYNFV